MSINSVRSNPSPQISRATDPQAPAVPKAVYEWKEPAAGQTAAPPNDSYTQARPTQVGFSGAAAPANAGNPKMAFEGYQPASRPTNAGDSKAYEAWPANQGRTAQGIRS